ncbi:MAG: esterase family protein, partial [Chitinophagaceae bacterium]
WTGRLFAGTSDSISVYSEAMKKNIPVIVIKPSGYNKSKARLNVVFLLHGYSGNHRQWLRDAPQLTTLADTYNLLIVCPDGGFSSWYFDSPIDSTVRYETFMSKELIAYIDKNYRTKATRSSRAISGLSMGGHGGLFLASRHTDVYGTAGSMAGGVNMRPFPNNWDIKKRIGDTACCEENWKKYSVISTIDSLKNGDLSMIIDCGTSDFFIGVNRELHQKLLDKKIDHHYTERPGGHNKDYWGQSVNYQLLFFKSYFDKHAEATIR